MFHIGKKLEILGRNRECIYETCSFSEWLVKLCSYFIGIFTFEVFFLVKHGTLPGKADISMLLWVFVYFPLVERSLESTVSLIFAFFKNTKWKKISTPKRQQTCFSASDLQRAPVLQDASSSANLQQLLFPLLSLQNYQSRFLTHNLLTIILGPLPLWVNFPFRGTFPVAFSLHFCWGGGFSPPPSWVWNQLFC